MMILAPIAAMLIQMAISRSREYDADAASAKYVGSPYPLINGLQKLETWSKRIPMDATPSTAHMFIIKPFTARWPERPVLDPPLHRGPHRAACRPCDERSPRQPRRRPAASPPGTRGSSRATSRIATAPSPARPSRWRTRADVRWARRTTAPLRRSPCACSRAQVEEIGRDFYLRRLRAAEAHRRARGSR